MEAPISTNLYDHSSLATEFNPALKWLGNRVAEDAEVLTETETDDEIDNDEIEEW